ncbi:MAG: DNA cytosine methyltransferase [Betaproteobacteria bacterium]|nr:DNA cytosine methyltransferase [Betaproteobacteria bacterium]
MHFNPTPTAIDLFCGCGGISVGLQKAGFQVLAGIDIERKYIASFQHNFPQTKTLTTDITILSPEEFMCKTGITTGKLDLLVGGPPCQGFSKNIPRRNRFLEDPKNLLIKSFLNYCEALQPKMILMENVAEMKNGFKEAYSQEIISRLQEAGYTVTAAVLNSADYGVPQRRRRAFFMANRLGLQFAVPTPSHKPQDSALKKNFTIFEEQKHITVWDAIGDLPSVEHGKGDEFLHYAIPAQTEFQRKMRGNCIIVRNHIARKLAPIQYQRLASLLPGQGHKNLPEHLQTKGGYSGAYGRLTKEMIAPTITRWVFHPGSGRWGHPIDIRTLTIREIARIQSFPDNFVFVGSYTDQAGQLGNAVPPLLAQELITSMSRQLALLRKPTKVPQETFLKGSLKAIA